MYTEKSFKGILSVADDTTLDVSYKRFYNLNCLELIKDQVF